MTETLNKPLVSICCLSYNHEKYIAQALESFLMQKTNFPFEILVHDDASPDKSQSIIKEYESKYPHIIKPIYQSENQKSRLKYGMNPHFNFPRAKGKFIAMCEGDDYWIDPLKLQKQVDFLENNPNCNLCVTNGKIYHQDSNTYSFFTVPKKQINRDNKVSLKYIFSKRGVVFPTASYLFRKNIIDEVFFDILNRSNIGDRVIQLRAIYNGDICSLNDITCIYRVNLKGTSYTSQNKKVYKSDLLQQKLDKNQYLKTLYKNKYNEFIAYSDSITIANEIKRSHLNHSKWYQINQIFKYWKRIKFNDYLYLAPRILLTKNRFF